MTHKTTLVLAMLAILTGAAQAQSIYHCTDPTTGKPVFSQIPCAPDAQTIEADYHRPTPEQAAEAARIAAEKQRRVDDGIRRRREMKAEAARYRAIAAAEESRARELAAIRERRSRAYNNAAGAALEGALATDEGNINARYEAEMRRLRGEL